MAASMIMAVFFDVASRSLMEIDVLLEVFTFPIIRVLKMAVHTCEMVNFHKTAWCNMPKDIFLKFSIVLLFTAYYHAVQEVLSSCLLHKPKN
jgi:hypothetical protein